MGIATFLFGREVSRTMIGDFMVDCTISMVTDLSAQATKNPIQTGKSGAKVVSDHITINPMVFKIEGFISESPIGDFVSELSTLAGGVAGGLLGGSINRAKLGGGAALAGTGLGAILGSSLGGALGKFTGIRADAGGNRDNAGQYPRIAMKTLIKAFESREPFRIRTFFHREEKNNIYENMVITALSFPQDKTSGNGLKFSLTAEKITIVSLVVGTADGSYVLGVQAANSAEEKTDLGRQGDQAAKETTKKKTSGLFENIGKPIQDAMRGL